MISFEMVYSNKLANALLKQQIKKLAWLYVVISLLFVIMGINFLIKNSLAPAIVFFCVGVLYAPLCIFFSNLINKKNFQQMAFSGDKAILKVSFGEEFVTITQQLGKELKSVTQASYNFFTRVEENSGFVFLYITSGQSFVVDKTAIQTGSLEDLKQIFLEKIPNKYIIGK